MSPLADGETRGGQGISFLGWQCVPWVNLVARGVRVFQKMNASRARFLSGVRATGRQARNKRPAACSRCRCPLPGIRSPQPLPHLTRVARQKAGVACSRAKLCARVCVMRCCECRAGSSKKITRHLVTRKGHHHLGLPWDQAGRLENNAARRGFEGTVGRVRSGFHSVQRERECFDSHGRLG